MEQRFSGDVHFPAMSVYRGSFTDILGDCSGALGRFPLLWEETSKPFSGDGRLLRVSALKLNKLVTFHFFPHRLQLPGLLSANKWCQVKLGKSRGEESPGIFWGAFLPQGNIFGSLCICVSTCVLFRPKERDLLLIAEVKSKN